jgi:tripeptidyl-peptidase-1
MENNTRHFKSALCLEKGCITSDREFSIGFDRVGWTAGGGFDIYHNETPSWQASVVQAYLQNAPQLPPSGHFNARGRAYPDVASLGHSCPTVIDGMLGGVDGTSCSSPMTAGLFGVVNQHLFNIRQHKLGFANPLLYHMATNCDNCFRDITDGYNWCTEETCCENTTQYGFQAIVGYDPVSGLGTPNIGNIKIFISTL